MAISNFRIHYKNGEPTIRVEDLKYINPESGNEEGAIALQVELTSPNMQNVLVQINSSQKILTALKKDPRVGWLLDVSGWDLPDVATKPVTSPRVERPDHAKQLD